MDFLDKIVSIKHEEVRLLTQQRSFDEIKKQCLLTHDQRNKELRSLRNALLQSTPFGIIAEIKRASPSRGTLTDVSCEEIAYYYAQSKADAISVLTDTTYFNGDISYLKTAKDIAPQPIFRKDFIIDEYQIYETALAHADAFLLIATLLDVSQLRSFISLSKELGLENIVEVHTEKEIEKAIEAGADIIGINNRDFATMTIDIGTTERLMPYIPHNIIVISESGISSSHDVQRVVDAGVKGILVGTSLIESKDPIRKIADLKAQI